MQKYDGQLLRQFQDPVYGIAANGVSIEVRKYSDNSMASIFANYSGSTPKANPLTTDNFGYYWFYAADGRYRIIFSDGRPEIEIILMENGPTGGGSELEPYTDNLNTRSLLFYGGIPNGDCTAAMNLALADPDCQVIIVPDNVTLGSHTFDADLKVIIGGKNVNFTGLNAGLRPRVCGHVEIKNFRDALLPAFPMTGGDANTGGVFVATAQGHDIKTLIIQDNISSRGRAGLTIGPESSANGILRNNIVIKRNTFSTLNGVLPGTGYGIQIANGNGNAAFDISHNKVINSNRNAFYVARNNGINPIFLNFNISVDHRVAASNIGDGLYPAFNIARSSGVIGMGNKAITPTDGSLLIGPEEDGAMLLNAKNIAWRDFTIDTPRNAVQQIAVQYLTVPADARTDFVVIERVNQTCVGIAAPVFEYNFGKRVAFRDIEATYVDIASGGYYAGLIKGGNTTNSGDILVERLRVVGKNCVNANFSALALAGGIIDQQLKLILKDISYEVDSTNRKFFEPSAAVSNALIEAYNCGITGMVWAANVGWRIGSNPSIQTISRIFNPLGFFTPNGNITPNYIGEQILATDTKTTWLAGDNTNNGWICTGRYGADINEFKAGLSNKQVAEGFAKSTTVAEFYLNAINYTLPSNLVVTSTFKVVDITGATVGSGTGKTPTIDLSQSSNCKTVITVSGLTGLTVNQPLKLFSESSSSALAVTY